MVFKVSVLLFPAFNVKINLQFSQVLLVLRRLENVFANEPVESALNAHERIVGRKVDVEDAAVFEQPGRDRVPALVRGRVASAHDDYVLHEHPCLQVEVPEAPVLQDVSYELQYMYSSLCVRQGQVAFVAKYY